MERQLYQLETDPALKRLVAPLDLVEFSGMEEDIRRRGGEKGVKVWGRTILVDHEYYEYCHRENIPFCLVSISLDSYQEAVAWICKNQLLRKSLNEEMRKYLIGKRSLAERTIGLVQMRKLENNASGQERPVMKLARHNVSRTHVRERIGTEYSLAYMTVRKYESYTLALDMVRTYSPELVDEHLAGRLKLSFEKVYSLAALPPGAACSECLRLMTEPREAGPGSVKSRCGAKESCAGTVAVVSIKDMPVYDPDAEIVSLSLTIPSWISSIIRVRGTSNMEEVSTGARDRLKKELTSLKSTVDKMLYALRGKPNERI